MKIHLWYLYMYNVSFELQIKHILWRGITCISQGIRCRKWCTMNLWTPWAVLWQILFANLFYGSHQSHHADHQTFERVPLCWRRLRHSEWPPTTVWPSNTAPSTSLILTFTFEESTWRHLPFNLMMVDNNFNFTKTIDSVNPPGGSHISQTHPESQLRGRWKEIFKGQVVSEIQATNVRSPWPHITEPRRSCSIRQESHTHTSHTRPMHHWHQRHTADLAWSISLITNYKTCHTRKTALGNHSGTISPAPAATPALVMTVAAASWHILWWGQIDPPPSTDGDISTHCITCHKTFECNSHHS